MNTLEELIYYCNETEPVGAIMLAGEWGCGKTYLLDNILKKELIGSHVILRISLFGLDSVEAVRKEVKRSWLYALAESNESMGGMIDVAKKVSKVAGKFSKSGLDFLPKRLKTLASSAVSIDIFEFIRIKPTIDNLVDGTKKIVVLVFDDLERSNVSACDLLGCINDYCENLHMHIIVVTNEEKMKLGHGENNHDKISYDEIKEKIIQRTIRFKPNYEEIVSNVIDDMAVKEGDVAFAYKNFLIKNKESICTIFSGSWMDNIPLEQLISGEFNEYLGRRTQSGKLSQLSCSSQSREEHDKKIERLRQLLEQRPHNIRSLKFALQDFVRIYSMLTEKQIGNVEKWLFSYLSYVLCCRAGLVSDVTGVGALFTQDQVAALYAGYYSGSFITNGIKQWVKHGEWDAETLDGELEAVINRDKAVTPEEKAQTWELLALEETDVREGYPLLLDKAYAGELELNDYVNLLHNGRLAREYNIAIPKIDWNRIYDGLHHKMDAMVDAQEARRSYRVVLNEENRNMYSDEEWCVWEMIDNFLSKNEFTIRKNKKTYLELMKSEPMNALLATRNLQLEAFEPEMATVTADAFISLSNAEKGNFVDSFRGMWHLNIEAQNCDIALSEKGFQMLRQCLTEYLGKCQEKKCTIAAVHTEKFIKVVVELMSDTVGE